MYRKFTQRLLLSGVAAALIVTASAPTAALAQDMFDFDYSTAGKKKPTPKPDPKNGTNPFLNSNCVEQHGILSCAIGLWSYIIFDPSPEPPPPPPPKPNPDPKPKPKPEPKPQPKNLDYF